MNFAVPAIAPSINAHSASYGTAPSGPATDPIAPPTNDPTAHPVLLLSDALPLSSNAKSVNTKEHTYTRYKILTLMNMKVMFFHPLSAIRVLGIPLV